MDTKTAAVGLTVILVIFAVPTVAENRGRDSGRWKVIGLLSGVLMLVITAFLGGTLVRTLNLPKPETDALLKLLGLCSIPLGPVLCILWLWLRGPIQPPKSADQTNFEALSPKDSSPNPTISVSTVRYIYMLIALASGVLLLPLLLSVAAVFMFPGEEIAYGNGIFWAIVAAGGIVAAAIAVWTKRKSLWHLALLGFVVVFCFLLIWLAC